MSKLLQGRLPFVTGNSNSVDSVTFNRTVRLLEISLDSFNPDATPQFTRTKRDSLKFNAGDIIWNTSIEILQVYDGDKWVSISQELPYTTNPLEATGEVGVVQIINKGAIVVNVHG
jgi:hypothetical protein|tara:strand:+ start:3064 stop:3411 length:348 start_codon:yes stop_codon:yes gene_type:complete